MAGRLRYSEASVKTPDGNHLVLRVPVGTPEGSMEWKGYPDMENSWVNDCDMNAPELIAHFESPGSS
ncbi:hypothetical protein MMPV_004423 [Pyropia vietnamensis]